MKDETSKKILVSDRRVLYRGTLRGWAIVVIPDGIMIDSFFNGVHFHLSMEKSSVPKKVQIAIKDPNIIHEKICRHLELEGKIKWKLLDELR